MARSRKPQRRRPARGRRLPSLSVLRLPELDQRRLDLIGLGCVALGVFLALVLYLGGGGGTVGRALRDALRLLFGLAGYAAPVALAAGGLALVLRPVLPSLRPLRAGGLCLLAAATLALAAGMVGPGGAAVSWHAHFLEARGGALGEGTYWIAKALFSRVGAEIIAVFLGAAGVLLLTGLSIAGALQASAARARDATRMLKTVAPLPAPIAPPEPPDTHTDVVISAARIESPLDGAEHYPDLFDHGEVAEPEPEPHAEDEEPHAEVPELEPDPPDEEPGITVTDADLTPRGRYRASITDDPAFEWTLPDETKLKHSTGEQSRPDTAGQEKVAGALVEALGHFGVQAKVVGTVTGPHITRYEIRLAPGTKVNKVANLKDDLAYALAATDIRILAPIPGKQAVGIEVPNARRRIVHLGDVMGEPPHDASPLMVWLGKDVAGRSVGADLARMPHLLVAGTTGAGKSGCVNAMLSSILLRATPHEVRLVLVDPKQVELNHYDSIPHLLTPVITSPRMAANALQNLVREMEERYGMMSLARTRSLDELNRARAKRGEAALPYVLCVIDELADLMMVAPADVEDSIIRLAQKARAVGIHLVLATQSPRVDVITGMIKANVPSRIAFAVSSQTDSRVILDQNGAESLLGKGDMLFSPVGTSKLQRIQGAFIDEAQIAALTEHWRRQGEPELREDLLDEVESEEAAGAEGEDEFDPDEDPLLEEAISLVAQMGTASTSMLQRRLRLGYTRAGRLIDMLERRGIISGYEGSKPRQVLITEADLPRVLQSVGAAPADSALDDLATVDDRGE